MVTRVLPCVLVALCLPGPGSAGEPDATAKAPSKGRLPPGFVQGDVVSYSYVPIRRWSPKEGLGILPYLFEYALMKHDDDAPLEQFHAENIRRIDLASAWSTAIMLYPRRMEYRDEIIRLMIRCFRHRQLIILSEYVRPDDPEALAKVTAILDKLWENRHRTLVSPEGDRATGRELINNILAIKLGDEGLGGLGTAGLEKVYDTFHQRVRYARRDGERPFRHVRGWYNEIAYAALNYDGPYAATLEDVEKHGRHKLPANTQIFGVDCYHYWFPKYSPFDPGDLSIPRSRVRAHTNEWHRIRTRYYHEGVRMRRGDPARGPRDWVPECWSDTHALLGAIELAGAKDAMMWYIGLSSNLDNTHGNATYTTPIETMDAYYDELKAGPWVGLSWWVFEGWGGARGTIEYIDRTLKHYTPEHAEGKPYSKEMLDYWHDAFVASRMRMFNDVVYRQFAHLNGKRPGEDPSRPPEKPQGLRGRRPR